jgi:hypothetical protein
MKATTFHHGDPGFRLQGTLTSKVIVGLKDKSRSGDSSMNDCHSQVLRKVSHLSQFRLAYTWAVIRNFISLALKSRSRAGMALCLQAFLFQDTSRPLVYHPSRFKLVETLPRNGTRPDTEMH